MDDSEIQKLVKRNNELQEQIGVLKNNEKQLNKALKDKDKEIKSIKESYSDADAKIKEYEHLKEIETNYNKLISSKRDDLIHDIVGDDKEKAKTLEHMDIKDLENIKELMTGDTAPTGITPNQMGDVPLDDGNLPTPTDDGDGMSAEEVVEFYEKEFGEKPSFINE